MIVSMSRQPWFRRIGIVILSFAIAGCKKSLPPAAVPSTEKQGSTSQNVNKNPSLPASNRQEQQKSVPPSKKAPETGDGIVSPPPKAYVALTADEQNELAEARKKYVTKAWTWETDQIFKRQRPVGLIIIRYDGMEKAIPTSLKYAKSLVQVGWDVKLLMYATGNDRDDLEAIRTVRIAIEETNKHLETRREEEKGKLPPDVAPLRHIDVPGLFDSVASLDKALDYWLAKNFLDINWNADLEDDRVPRSRPNGKLTNLPAFVTRPPFAGISFNGHGISVRLNPHLGDGEQKKFSDKFVLSLGQEFDLNRVETLALRKYQASIWMMTDICRRPVRHGVPENDKTESKVDLLKPRRFANIENLEADAKRLVDECEELRAKVSAGFLHRSGTGITWLKATQPELAFDGQNPKRILHHQLGTLVERTVDPKDLTRGSFKLLGEKATSITLSQANEWVTEEYKTLVPKAPFPRPDLIRGTFSENAVVFNATRGRDTYPPQYPNLLTGGILPEQQGFTVPEFNFANDAGNAGHYGPVTMVRPKTADGKNAEGFKFFSLFKFKDSFQLTRGFQYQMILLVSASGADHNLPIKFTTGVYDSNKLNSKQDDQHKGLLNASFNGFPTAESHKSPILCDGKPKLIHIPLTWFNNPEMKPKDSAPPEPEVAGLEIQASPDTPETNWQPGMALILHAVYLVPLNLTDDQLKADIDRIKTHQDFEKMAIWNVPLHEKPEAVSIKQQETPSSMKQSIEGYKGWWGMSGEIYPKMYLESGTRQLRLRLKVAAEDEKKISPQAEVGVCIYSDRQVMATWRGSLKSVVEAEQVIPIQETGMAQDVALVVRNHSGEITITRMALEVAQRKK